MDQGGSRVYCRGYRRWAIRLATIALLGAAALGGSSCLIHELGGAFDYEPEEMGIGLSVGAKQLVGRAYAGLSPQQLFDYHTHLGGIGNSGSGVYLNPKSRSWLKPSGWLKFRLFSSAAGITDVGRADEQYIDRLARLVRTVPGHGKHLLLAFEKYHSDGGVADLSKTPYFVPNAYAQKIASHYPDVFVAAGSVHPYRKDAAEVLAQLANSGVRVIKWLPNTMNIDPASARCDAFYAAMKKHDMVLLSHTGDETSLDSHGGQHLGNPLRLRRALNAGVTVLMAHCAADGEGSDFESKGNPRRSNFDLFLRLMRDPQYVGQLFGEISAITTLLRNDQLEQLLCQPELHRRLVNGSDYPVPSINFVIHTSDFVKAKMLRPEEASYLDEIYEYNPLLYDFVLKRAVRCPSTGQGFDRSVFTARVAPAQRSL